MSKAKLKYILFAPSFSETSGGAIFLHAFAQELQNLGETVLFEPAWPRRTGGRLVWGPRRWLKRRRFKFMPGSSVKKASIADLKDKNAVIVYPEAVLGNPTKVNNVVRWLLYPPGVEAPYQFTPGEMFFAAGQISDLPEVTGGAPDLFVWKLNPVYRNENRPDRKGVCYIVRKGHRKKRIPETEDPSAIQIDGMSHAEVNEVFNKCDLFVSYDEATMYSQFAAICGCDSVIVPGMFASRQEWTSSHDLATYGVAYGMDDLAHSQATKDKVRGMLLEKEQNGRDTVKNFVTLTQERFAK